MLYFLDIYKFIMWMKKSVDPNQLASVEASCFESILFFKRGYRILKVLCAKWTHKVEYGSEILNVSYKILFLQNSCW